MLFLWITQRREPDVFCFALFPTYCFKSLGPNSWLLLVRDLGSLYKILFTCKIILIMQIFLN